MAITLNPKHNQPQIGLHPRHSVIRFGVTEVTVAVVFVRLGCTLVPQPPFAIDAHDLHPTDEKTFPRPVGFEQRLAAAFGDDKHRCGWFAGGFVRTQGRAVGSGQGQCDTRGRQQHTPTQHPRYQHAVAKRRWSQWSCRCNHGVSSWRSWRS